MIGPGEYVRGDSVGASGLGGPTRIDAEMAALLNALAAGLRRVEKLTGVPPVRVAQDLNGRTISLETPTTCWGKLQSGGTFVEQYWTGSAWADQIGGFSGNAYAVGSSASDGDVVYLTEVAPNDWRYEYPYQCASVCITVTDDGSPASDISVTLTPTSGDPVTGTTDAGGRYCVQLALGTWTCAVGSLPSVSVTVGPWCCCGVTADVGGTTAPAASSCCGSGSSKCCSPSGCAGLPGTLTLTMTGGQNPLICYAGGSWSPVTLTYGPPPMPAILLQPLPGFVHNVVADGYNWFCAVPLGNAWYAGPDASGNYLWLQINGCEVGVSEIFSLACASGNFPSENCGPVTMDGVTYNYALWAPIILTTGPYTGGAGGILSGCDPPDVTGWSSGNIFGASVTPIELTLSGSGTDVALNENCGAGGGGELTCLEGYGGVTACPPAVQVTFDDSAIWGNLASTTITLNYNATTEDYESGCLDVGNDGTTCSSGGTGSALMTVTLSGCDLSPCEPSTNGVARATIQYTQMGADSDCSGAPCYGGSAYEEYCQPHQQFSFEGALTYGDGSTVSVPPGEGTCFLTVCTS